MPKPKLCFISCISPFTANNGSSIRINAFLDRLTSDWDVSVYSLSRFDVNKEKESEIATKCGETVLVPNLRSRTHARLRWVFGLKPYKVYLSDFSQSSEIVSIVRRLKESHFDQVLAIETESLPLIRKVGFPAEKCWMDIHNWHRSWCESFIASKSLSRRIYGHISLLKQDHFEQKYFNCVKNVVCVSEEDRDQARKTFKDHRYLVVPNGVSEKIITLGEEILSVSKTREPNVLFVGSLDVEMNVLGIEWLVKEVWPHVAAKRPDATLSIVGRRPDARVTRLSGNSVRVFGDVADVAPYYRECSVIVNPVMIGGGSKLKVIEALATGIPLVSTSPGLVGIASEVSKDVFIADEPLQFAQQIIANLDSMPRPPSEAVYKYKWSNIASELSRAMLENVDASRCVLRTT